MALSWSTNLRASHIVGGEISIQYTGTANTFSVSVIFFRDCGGAAFPGNITMNIYDLVTDVKSPSFPAGFVLNPGAVIPLTLGDGCYTPTLCIEKRVYSATIVIPSNPNGYYLDYTLCCRNAAITNITAPGSASQTFYAEIPNPALGNSSPAFSVEPDGYMCQNYVNTDQFSATDADGDVLVYSLTDPLNTGPKPYTPITWQAGYYTTNPIGDPGMIVNPTTGVINTLPPNLGVFVLSMKVEEFRAGVKIGEIRRDFQFQVLNCTLLNLSINPGNPICLGQVATIVPSGAGAGFSYAWSPGGQATSSIIVTPVSTGSTTYSVTATNGTCVKQASTTLVTNPNPVATLTVTGDVCAGQNNTLSAYGGITYSWSNGSPLSAISVSPGTYTVWVTNSFNCSKSAVGTIVAPVASSYTWTGAGATGADNWFDSNNWGNADGCIPSCLTDVLIPNAPAQAVSNSPDIGISSGAAACKDITIASGNKITFSSTNAELDICGDFIDNGVILNNGGQEGIMKFMGSVPQNFLRSGTASGNPLYQVIIANTGLPIPKVTVLDEVGYQDFPISNFGSLIFQSGILVTEGVRKVKVISNASGAISGHGANSYVVGRLNRTVSAGVSYDFPVGNMPVYGNVYPYQLMTINFSALNGITDITSSFENPLVANATGTGLPVFEGTTGGSYGTLLDNGGLNTGIGYPGGIGGLWTVIPNSYTATPVYDMTLKGTNYANSGANEHTILKRNTFCPGIWALSGTYASSSVAGNVVTVTRTGMTGFSQEVIASTPVPLPIELVLFDAACQGDNTILSWVTASETNNDYFTLERSCNENFFQYEKVATISGAGNSSTTNYYNYTDSNETPGECYYRLTQTDYDGTATDFPPLAIDCNENSSFNFVGVLPNPAQHEVNVLFTAIRTDVVTIELSDVAGKLLLAKEVLPKLGLNKEKISISEFTGGVYFMRINNGSKSFVKKVIKRD